MSCIKDRLAALIVVLIVCVSPWAYGAVEGWAELWLYVGIALLTILNYPDRSGWPGRGRLDRLPGLALLGLASLALFQTTAIESGVLASIAPSLAAERAKLVPASPERVLGDADLAVRLPATTLSLEPDTTLRMAARLAAAWLLFQGVLGLKTSPGLVVRFAYVVVFNAALLAHFAIIQGLTWNGRIYWVRAAHASMNSWSTGGPFLNHSHLAAYLNMALGLALGLLLQGNGRGLLGIGSMKPWTAYAAAIIGAGVISSHSRSGFLGLLVASIVLGCFLGRRLIRLGWLLAVVALLSGLCLVALGNTSSFGSRLATIFDVENEGYLTRLQIWRGAFLAWWARPWWGSGFGVFPVAITPFLKHSNKWVFFARAENEYIDMMVEGGAIGFILVLAFLAGIGGLVRRATRARAGGHEASLIGGASFGLIALAVQSGADFAPHVPAVGVFAVVLCGLIVRQGRAAATGPDHMGPRSACMPAGENRWSEEVVSDELFPVSAFTGSSAGGSEQASAFDRRSRAPSILTKLSWSGSVALAALLVSQAGRDAWIERRLEDAGLPSPGTFLTTMGPFEKATGLYPPREVPRIGVMTTLPVFEMAAHELDDYCMVLEEVLRRRPDWSEGYVRLGLAHLGLYRQQTKQEANDHRVESDDIKRAAKALGVSGKSQEMTERVTAPGQQRNRLFAGPVVSHLVSAARCFLEARRCSPFLALPHAELAGLGELLATRDPAITYAARALRLAGYDGPSLAYLAHIAVQAGDRKLAAQCWRKSLEANPASWTEVADTSQAFLSSEEILQDVAAGGGDAIRFADRLYREANDRAVRDRFLEVAIERLSARPDLITAEEVFLTGHALAKLNQSARAGKEMERALAQVPGQAAWREEYIEWLLRWGRPEEAHSQALKGRYFSPESKAISEAVDRTAQVLADGGMSP